MYQPPHEKVSVSLHKLHGGQLLHMWLALQIDRQAVLCRDGSRDLGKERHLTMEHALKWSILSILSIFLPLKKKKKVSSSTLLKCFNFSPSFNVCFSWFLMYVPMYALTRQWLLFSAYWICVLLTVSWHHVDVYQCHESENLFYICKKYFSVFQKIQLLLYFWNQLLLLFLLVILKIQLFCCYLCLRCQYSMSSICFI